MSSGRAGPRSAPLVPVPCHAALSGSTETVTFIRLLVKELENSFSGNVMFVPGHPHSPDSDSETWLVVAITRGITLTAGILQPYPWSIWAGVATAIHRPFGVFLWGTALLLSSPFIY